MQESAKGTASDLVKRLAKETPRVLRSSAQARVVAESANPRIVAAPALMTAIPLKADSDSRDVSLQKLSGVAEFQAFGDEESMSGDE